MLIDYQYGPVTVYKAARTLFKKPLYYTHFYSLGDLLIDCGPSQIGGEVLPVVKKKAFQKLAVTHEHEDHCGNCSLIKEELKIPVYAHPETLSYMANPPSIQLYRHLMWGAQPPVEGKPAPQNIRAGEFSVKVIHTPGHSTGHISFFEPENRFLFCGDLYLGEKLNGFMDGENIADHLQSLEKVIALQPAVIFCGLKGKLEDATNRLKRKRETWWELSCQAIEMHEKGYSRNEILQKFFSGEVYFFYLSERNWGRGYMLDSILENIDFFKKKATP